MQTDWFLASRSLDPSKLKKMAVSCMTKVDEFGLTALIHAAQAGNEENVHFLLAKEGNIHAQCNYTALMAAVEFNHPNIVHILAAMQAGQRIRALLPRDLKQLTSRQSFHNYKSGTTALIIAAEQLNMQIFNYLEKKEADASDFSPCHIAAFKHLLGAVEADIINIERPDIVGRIPLFYAILRPPSPHEQDTYERLLRVLIPRSHAFDKYGKTALHYAVEADNQPAVKFLVGWMAGLGVRATCMQYPHGTCAVHIAVQRNLKGMFNILKKYESDCVDSQGLVLDAYCQKNNFEAPEADQDQVLPTLDVDEMNQEAVCEMLLQQFQTDPQSCVRNLVRSLAKSQSEARRASLKPAKSICETAVFGVSNLAVDEQMVKKHEESLRQLKDSVSSSDLKVSSLNENRMSDSQVLIREKFAQYERTKHELQEQVKNLTNELQIVHERHQMQIKNFINLADDTSSTSSGMRNEITKLRTDLLRTKEQRDQQQQQFVQEKSQLMAEIASLNNVLEQQQRKNQQLERINTDLQDELTQLRLYQQEQQLRNESYQNHMQSLDEKMNTMMTRSAVAVKDNQISSLQDESYKASETIQQFQQQIQQIQQDFQQKQIQMNVRNAELSGVIQQKNQIITDLQSQTFQFSQRIESLTQQIVKQQESSSQSHLSEQKIIEQELQLEQKQNVISRLQDQLGQADDQVELLTRELSALSDNFQSIQQQYDLNLQDNADLSARVLALVKQLEDAETAGRRFGDEIVELNLALVEVQQLCASVGVNGLTPLESARQLVGRYARFVTNFRKGVSQIVERSQLHKQSLV